MSILGRFRLDGRVAMVTGASRGLGRAIATGLAEAGAEVRLCARDREGLEEVASGIRSFGGVATVASFDLGDPNSVARAVPDALSEHGRLDILVNNGAVTSSSSLIDSTLSEWQRVFTTNVDAMYLLSREAAKPMIEQGHGRIINVGSYVSTLGREQLAAYTASKHAVIGLTRSIAGELGRHGVTCNAIAPGFFNTDMAAASGSEDPERARVFRSAIALGRFGEPEEVAGAAVYLASDAASYVTGLTLHVDGGIANALSLPLPVHRAEPAS